MEPGLIISQPNFVVGSGSGEIVFQNAALLFNGIELTFDPTSDFVPENASQIGNVILPLDQFFRQPRMLVQNETPFIIRSRESGNEYLAQLTFFRSPQTGDISGLPPTPDFDVGTVITASLIPEPSVVALFVLAFPFFFKRKRSKDIF